MAKNNYSKASLLISLHVVAGISHMFYPPNVSQFVTKRPLPSSYLNIPDIGIGVYFAPFAFLNPGITKVLPSLLRCLYSIIKVVTPQLVS